jgi:hypothetical protein
MILRAPLLTSLSYEYDDGGPAHLLKVRRTAVVEELVAVSLRGSCQ